MRTRFIACPACARHVRDGDCACPFCGTAVPCAKPLRTIKGRLSRAALHAAGAAGAVVAIADCSSSPPQPFYGGACVGGSCITVTDAGADAQPDASADASEEAADAGKGAPTDANGTD